MLKATRVFCSGSYFNFDLSELWHDYLMLVNVLYSRSDDSNLEIFFK